MSTSSTWARRLRRLALLVVIGATIVWVAIAAMLYTRQDDLLFHPIAAVERTPGDRGMPFEELTLTTEDGETIAGWYVRAAEPRGTLLFFHGNAGNIGHRIDSIATFVELGLDVMIIDYRGYGTSTGTPSEAGMYLDARAAWHHLTGERGLDRKHIVVFGRSLGGGVAVHLAGEITPGGLIVESSFTSLPDLASELYPLFAVPGLVRNRFDSLETIKYVDAPVLVAHSPDDELIPYAHGRRLFEAIADRGTFLELGGGHNDGPWVTGPSYAAGLDAYLSAVLGD